jgi:enoyl-[acyl-carrier protein] reductase II
VAAALALGADAVSVGTRLVASQEAYAHDDYKRRIVAASAEDIARTALFGPEWPDQPMRVIRNRVVREWAGRDHKTPPSSDPPHIIGRTVVLGQAYAMPKFSAILPTPDTTGDFEEMCLAAGEGTGLVKAIKPVAQIVPEMMDEAKRIIEERLVPIIGD